MDRIWGLGKIFYCILFIARTVQAPYTEISVLNFILIQ